MGGGFVERRVSIESLAHIVFDSNPKSIEFWLGGGVDSADQIRQRYGALKPCMHGCDAHKEADLGAPGGDRYTWVKGDASFGTLRMACLSPASRVHIGPRHPAADEVRNRLARISVENAPWFTNHSVELNPGLVAIIGSRGSGKTALADLIAAAAGHPPDGHGNSFIRRADDLLAGSTAEVAWTGGDVSRCTFGEERAGDEWGLRGVRYLSQQFVEQLCSTDGVSEDLLDEIKRVVFNAWPIDRREQAADFQDLLTRRLAAHRATREATQQSISAIGDEITDQLILKRNREKWLAERDSTRIQVQELDVAIKAKTGLSGRAIPNDLLRYQPLWSNAKGRRKSSVGS